MNKFSADSSRLALRGLGTWNLAQECWDTLLTQSGMRPVVLPGSDSSSPADTIVPLFGNRGDSMRQTLKRIIDRGWLLAALPAELGGIQLGGGGQRSRQSLDAIIWLARTNAAAARMFASHVSAVRLLQGFGNEDQLRLLQQITLRGHLLQLLSDVQPGALCLSDDARVLRGRIQGELPVWRTDAVIVRARWRSQEQLCLVDLVATPEGCDPARHSTDEHGVEAREREGEDTGVNDASYAEARYGMDRDELVFDEQCCFSRLGEPDSARREPWFGGGAWRDAAVMLGALYAYLDLAMTDLENPASGERSAIETLLPVIASTMGTRRLLVDAARFADGVEGERAPQDAVWYSGCARSLIDDAARRALHLVGGELSHRGQRANSLLRQSGAELHLMLNEVPESTPLARACDYLARETVSVSEFDPAQRYCDGA